MSAGVLAVDTSVAVPLLVADHQAHGDVRRWARGRELHLAGHAATETYAVLTRLPGDLRLAPDDAGTLVERRFVSVLRLVEPESSLPRALAGLGVAGGATYDALVALAAAQHGATLATRDLRARDTYERVGVTVVVAG